jgi:hypothetical protein
MKKLLLLNPNLIQKLINISLLIIVLRIVIIFSMYFQTKRSLDNPLIPESLINLVFEPYAFKGLLLSIGLVISLIFRMTKRYKIALVNDLFWIIITLSNYAFNLLILENK